MRKLVRDKIPDLEPQTEAHANLKFRRIKAGSAEHIQLLREKLQEEVQEYLANPTVEELADIVAVCEALGTYECRQVNAAVQGARIQKKIKRGEFDHPVVAEDIS